MSSLSADLIPLASMASRFPGARGADTSHPATWTRWILKGVLGADGRRHKLAATRFGARWMVTESAVQSFFAALSPPTDTLILPEQPKPEDRRRAVELANRECELVGA